MVNESRTLLSGGIGFKSQSKLTEAFPILPLFFYHGATAPSEPGSPHCRGFMITLRRTTFGRSPLDEWSARRRDLYLTTNNTHKRQTTMPPRGFEPTIPASERPQTNALARPLGFSFTSLTTNSETVGYLKLGHDRFLSHPFQLIPH